MAKRVLVMLCLYGASSATAFQVLGCCGKLHVVPAVVAGRPLVPLAGKRRESLTPIRSLKPRRHSAAVALTASSGDKNKGDGDDKLPPAVLPICLGVFVQMLGEGIAISSIPLHLKGFGASAMQVGLATSAFSFAQMLCCPLIVKLSSRIGRTLALRLCLSGATAAAFVIALSPTINGVIFGRLLAGIFAASVPVAQAGVTDLVPRDQSALALSRVASANQMGIVVGPAASALLASAFGVCGLAADLQMRAVFAVSGLFALGVLALDKFRAPLTPAKVLARQSMPRDRPLHACVSMLHLTQTPLLLRRWSRKPSQTPNLPHPRLFSVARLQAWRLNRTRRLKSCCVALRWSSAGLSPSRCFLLSTLLLLT